MRHQDSTRAGVIANAVDLGSGEARIDRDGPGIEAARGEKRRYRGNRILVDNEKAVTAAHATLSKCARECEGCLAQLLIGERPPIRFGNRDSVGRARCPAVDMVVDAARQACKVDGFLSHPQLPISARILAASSRNHSRTR